jgi:hypothetical protein
VTEAGKDGRPFPVDGRIKTEADLELIQLPDPTRDELFQEAEVRGLIQDLGPGGGYIISSGNSLASYLKPDCVLAMSQAIQKYGQYPMA